MLGPLPHVACCWMLLDVVACCCAKFETGQIFQPTTPNISFVLWSPKGRATMLDPFAQLFQNCWGHARALHMVPMGFTKSYGLYTSHHALQVLTLLATHTETTTPHSVGSCYVRLHVPKQLSYLRSFKIVQQTNKHSWATFGGRRTAFHSWRNSFPLLPSTLSFFFSRLPLYNVNHNVWSNLRLVQSLSGLK